MTANKSSVAKRGIDLLRDPQLNKSTAFTEAEREALGLTGLLPAAVDSEETQVRRALQQLGHKPTDLERYIYLIQLLDTDETLFYKVAMSDPARFLPILYDPTVGEACLKFGHVFRRPRGLYVSLKHKGRVKDVLRQLAGPGRACHLRHVRRAHPRPGRPGRQRHGHPHRQAAALHRLRRGAAPVSTADAHRLRYHQPGPDQ
jgi:hypothetical protein